jgi:TonB family protein
VPAALLAGDFRRGLDEAERLRRDAEESEDRAAARALQGWLSFYRAFQTKRKEKWRSSLDEATAFFREALDEGGLTDTTARQQARLGLAEALLWQLFGLEPGDLVRLDRAQEILNLAHETLVSATTPQIERRARLLICGTPVCEPARYRDWESDEEASASPGAAAEETGDSGGGEPVSMEEQVQPPKRLKATRPPYTDAAYKARVEGIIIVRAAIEKDGTVSDARVLRGLPLGLSEATVKAVESWIFEPATREGEPLSVWYNVTLNFTLH